MRNTRYLSLASWAGGKKEYRTPKFSVRRRVAFQEQERRQQRFFAHFARMDELRYLEQLNRFAGRVR